MQTRIQRLSKLHPSDISHMDCSFRVEYMATPPFEETALNHISSIAPYNKTYDFESDFQVNDHNPSVIIVANSAENIIEGYMMVSLDWNNCVIIEDFCVDSKHRGKGIGKLLMDEAVRWTTQIGLGTIRLETQNTNVPACRFYERYGFRLGGYDLYLYSAIEKGGRNEIALFYYLNL